MTDGQRIAQLELEIEKLKSHLAFIDEYIANLRQGVETLNRMKQPIQL